MACEKMEPVPKGAVLAVDGRDLGKEILGDVPGEAEYRVELERARREMEANTVLVSDLRGVVWEAERGIVMPNMVVGADAAAFNGKFVWAPCEPGARGGGSGFVSWQLKVEQAGTYRLWGRVSTATPEDDSFHVSAHAGTYSPSGRKGPQVFPRTDWHLGQTRGLWKWVQYGEPLNLPQGPVVLTVHVREDGAKLDRLFISSDPAEEPTD